jgi:hypothetical protein
VTYPLIIACELSSYEEDAFPVAIAWSLPDGSIKTTLISPEEEWLERADHLEVDPDQLLMEGHSAKAVLQELQLDRQDEPLYCIDPEQTEQALEQLYSSLDGCNDLPLLPLRDLLDEVDYQQLDSCREDCLMQLELDPQRADEQVRLWLEVYARLAQ